MTGKISNTMHLKLSNSSISSPGSKLSGALSKNNGQRKVSEKVANLHR